jgi:hypothetical protein
MRKVLDLIWGVWEQKYFSENQKKDSTRLSTTRPTGKSPDRAVQPATRKRKTSTFDAKLNARPACGVTLVLRPDDINLDWRRTIKNSSRCHQDTGLKCLFKLDCAVETF